MKQNPLFSVMIKEKGVPSHDTMQRVMGVVSLEILRKLYGKWQELLDKNCIREW